MRERFSATTKSKSCLRHTRDFEKFSAPRRRNRRKKSTTSEKERKPFPSTKAFFIAIGHKPNTDLFRFGSEMDETGYLKMKDALMKTRIRGVFAQQTRKTTIITAKQLRRPERRKLYVAAIDLKISISRTRRSG